MTIQREITVRPHKRLQLWEKLMCIVEDIYCITDALPKQEIYGLTLQMRRAAVSVEMQTRLDEVSRMLQGLINAYADN